MRFNFKNSKSNSILIQHASQLYMITALCFEMYRNKPNNRSGNTNSAINNQSTSLPAIPAQVLLNYKISYSLLTLPCLIMKYY